MIKLGNLVTSLPVSLPRTAQSCTHTLNQILPQDTNNTDIVAVDTEIFARTLFREIVKKLAL